MLCPSKTQHWEETQLGWRGGDGDRHEPHLTVMCLWLVPKSYSGLHERAKIPRPLPLAASAPAPRHLTPVWLKAAPVDGTGS